MLQKLARVTCTCPRLSLDPELLAHSLVAARGGLHGLEHSNSQQLHAGGGGGTASRHLSRTDSAHIGHSLCCALTTLQSSTAGNQLAQSSAHQLIQHIRKRVERLCQHA